MVIAAGFGEQELRDVIDVTVRIVEAGGAIVIVVGAAIAFGRFVLVTFRREGMAPFAPVRLDLGRFLALGLEFQLAADILRTAVAPSFTQLAQLAAIAAIRTALNFFLGREIKEQQKLIAADETAAKRRMDGQGTRRRGEVEVDNRPPPSHSEFGVARSGARMSAPR